MNCEQLVPTREVCQKLKDAGFPQDTVLSWFPLDPHEERIDTEGNVTGREPMAGDPTEFVFVTSESDDSLCAAPTYGELEEWLLCHDFDNILVKNESADGENAVGISCIHSDGRDFEAHSDDEIDALSTIVLEGLT